MRTLGLDADTKTPSLVRVSMCFRSKGLRRGKGLFVGPLQDGMMVTVELLPLLVRQVRTR